MNPRENLVAALEGENPDWIPLTINEEFLTKDPEWPGLLSAGLCRVSCGGTWRRTVTEGIETRNAPDVWQGKSAVRQITTTPAGEISRLLVDGWVQEYYLKEPADYRVMEYIVRHTRLEPDRENRNRFRQKEEEMGSQGITLLAPGRSPMQTILVDYVGLENFAYHLSEGFPEIQALYDALLDNLVRTCEIAAAGPGRYVQLLENLTAESWGPKRFAEFHLPVYEKILPILHAGGKKVYVHYDGRLACLAELIGRTQIDGIESLTMPPEGDLTYTEARNAWPDKFLWANIRVSDYLLQTEQLRKQIRNLTDQAAPDRRLLAFEISEDRPENWRESIPAVLETLKDL